MMLQLLSIDRETHTPPTYLRMTQFIFTCQKIIIINIFMNNLDKIYAHPIN